MKGPVLRVLFATGLSGAAVMITELTATRVMAPAFGTSIYTWTNVIGVVLLALTLGYAVGGRLADRRPDPSFLGIILLGAALLGLPAPFLAVPLGEWMLPDPEALNALTSTPHVVRGSLATTLLLFAPPLFLLGMVGPFATRILIDRGLGGGAAAGRTLAVSTLGSIIGTYLPAHVLISGLGSRATLLVAVGLLVLAGLLLVRGKRSRGGGTVLLLLTGGLGMSAGSLPLRGPLDMPPPVPGGPAVETAVLLEEETPYQYVRVARFEKLEGEARIIETRLCLDEGVLEYHSLLVEREDEKGGRRALPLTNGAYYDAFALLPEVVPDAEEHPLDVAIVGGGAGTMGRLLRAVQGGRIGRIASIELDPLVSGLAGRFGWQPGADDHLLVGDGRVLLRMLDHRFDLILLDAYARQLAIPHHLATVEFFRLAESRLSPRGLVALNVSVADLESPLFLALKTTLEEVFPHVAAVCIEGHWNVLLLAGRGRRRFLPAGEGGVLAEARRRFHAGYLEPAAYLPRGRLLTDDRAPLEALAREP